MSIESVSSYLTTYRTASTPAATGGSYLEITGGAGRVSGSDTVDVSEAARELLDRIQRLDVFSIIYPNADPRRETKTLGEVEGDFLADFTNFASVFGTMSAMMGLGPDESYVIGLDGVGGVSVSGTSASTAIAIQSGINGNSTAVSRFAVMAARAALVDAGNTLDGFSSAYEKDPVAAIANNIDALKERLLGFRAVAGGGSAEYGFMRNGSVEYGHASVASGVAETVGA